MAGMDRTAAHRRGEREAAPTPVAVVEALRGEFLARQPIRAGSLVVTLMGDAIAPREVTPSLGSLLRLLQAFGLNQRLVRTAMARLAAEGWLVRRQTGRLSWYRPSERARAEIEEASARIYAPPPQGLPATWWLALLPAGLGRRREALRRQLAWRGFGALGGDLLVLPATVPLALDRLRRELPELGEALLLHAAMLQDTAPETLRRLAQTAWNLDQLAARYEDFLARWRGLADTLAAGAAIGDEDALVARVLLIHDWRRIALRDPKLPAELLPEAWAGHRAFATCRDLYARLLAPAEAHLRRSLETLEGTWPALPASRHGRFGLG